MIPGLVQILLFQGAGELLSHFVVTMIPGPVIGMVLLIGWLQIRTTAPENVVLVSSVLTSHLGLLFVPAAVGVITFWPHLRTNVVAVGVALVASVALTIAVSALVLRLLSREDAG